MVNIQLSRRSVQLPDDVWLLIFSHLTPNVESQENVWSASSFYSLPTVCKQFNAILRRSTHLYRDLVLEKSVDDMRQAVPRLAALIKSLQQMQGNTESIMMDCSGPTPATAFATLFGSHSCLKLVHLTAAQPPDLEVLTAFRTITHCVLQPITGGLVLDLIALQALPNLTKLRLEDGHFMSVEACAHLTSLALDNSEVKCQTDCACVSSLRELSLCDARLLHFHSDGVSACAHLKALQCDFSTVGAVNHNQLQQLRFDRFLVSLPWSLSALSALTSLKLWYSAA